MSNIAGKAYAMTVITPMVPGWRSWLKGLIFSAGRALPGTLAGLLGLSIIHFARWAIIKRDQWPDLGQGKQDLQYDYMLFCSNFNGTWDQYVDAFSDGIPSGLDLFWYRDVKYPHSIPITPFKKYIVHNQLQTGYYYNATPGSAQREIKASLRVADSIKTLQEIHQQGDRRVFKDAYVKAFLNVQNSLGSPGEAPVASNDTADAARHRQSFIARQQQQFQQQTEEK